MENGVNNQPAKDGKQQTKGKGEEYDN